MRITISQPLNLLQVVAVVATVEEGVNRQSPPATSPVRPLTKVFTRSWKSGLREANPSMWKLRSSAAKRRQPRL